MSESDHSGSWLPGELESESTTVRNSNSGTCFPRTASDTVNGVDNSKPTGPHNHVQKIAATSRANDEVPVRLPLTMGSNTYATRPTPQKSASVSSVRVQPSDSRKARPAGMIIAIVV